MNGRPRAEGEWAASDAASYSALGVDRRGRTQEDQARNNPRNLTLIEPKNRITSEQFFSCRSSLAWRPSPALRVQVDPSVLPFPADLGGDRRDGGEYGAPDT